MVGSPLVSSMRPRILPSSAAVAVLTSRIYPLADAAPTGLERVTTRYSVAQDRICMAG